MPSPSWLVGRWLARLRDYVAEQQLVWDTFSQPLTYAYKKQMDRSPNLRPFSWVLPWQPSAATEWNSPRAISDRRQSRYVLARPTSQAVTSAIGNRTEHGKVNESVAATVWRQAWSESLQCTTFAYNPKLCVHRTTTFYILCSRATANLVVQ